MASGFSFEDLKLLHREVREARDYPESLSLRVHRALSWLKPAELATDVDTQFILYWIAFNAAYAKAVPEDDNASERDQMSEFFTRLVELDDGNLIYKAIWSDFSGPIRLLLDNQYVFAPFWRYQRGEVSKSDWEGWFLTSKHMVNKALTGQETAKILTHLFPRIYTLRNQVIHGGATWDSSVNRDQLRDCTAILTALVPIFIQLMMHDMNGDWDMPAYPAVEA